MVTSNSTVTSSRSLSAPKKPEYGVMPNSLCLMEVLLRYLPGHGAVRDADDGAVPVLLILSYHRTASMILWSC